MAKMFPYLLSSCCNSTCVLHPSGFPPRPVLVGVPWASGLPSPSFDAAVCLWAEVEPSLWAGFELWVGGGVEAVAFVLVKVILKRHIQD